MKKLSILFLSVVTLGLSVSSCSSDDNDSASIEGKWQLTEEGAILNGQEILQPVTNEGGCNSETYEYLENGTVINTYSEFYNSKCTEFTDNGTWSKDGNNLTEKYEGDSTGDTYEIAKLSGSQLKLKETYSEGGITFASVRVFKKI